MTWDPDFFNSTDLIIQVGVDLEPVQGDADPGMEGFKSGNIPAGTGKYDLAVTNLFIEDNQAMKASFFIFSSSEDGTTTRIDGPDVQLNPSSGSGSKTINPAAIIVPIVTFLLVAGLVGFWFWRRRQRAHARTVGGEVQVRMGNWGDDNYSSVGIPPPPPPSVPAGRNVFREEVQRQQYAMR